MRIGNNVRAVLAAAIDENDKDIVFNSIPNYEPIPNPRGDGAFAIITDSIERPTRFEIVSFSAMENNVIKRATRGALTSSDPQSWPAGSYIVQDYLHSEPTYNKDLSSIPANHVREIPTHHENFIEVGSMTPPTLASGQAQIYVDSVDGNLKLKEFNIVTEIAP